MTLLFCDGFDHYASTADPILGKWTTQVVGSQSIITASTSPTSRFGYGQGYEISAAGSLLRKDLGANYTTLIVGLAMYNTTAASAPQPHIIFYDSAASQQFTFLWNQSSNFWEARRGGTGGTLLGTASSGGGYGSWGFYEFKVLFNDTTGTVQIKLNGTSILSLTGQDTCNTANVNARQVQVGQSTSSANGRTYIDDLYICDTAGSRNNDFLGDVRVETLRPNADTAQRDFTTAYYALGGAMPSGLSSTAGSANVLRLAKYTAPGNGTLGTIGIYYSGSSASVKVKPVLYADSAGSPGALIAAGTETVGVTNSTTVPNLFTFGSPPSVTGGTVYWIGYITDTSTNIYTTTHPDATVTYSAANTYGSGAPGTAPSMASTGNTLAVYGIVTATTGNYAAVKESVVDGDYSYVASSTSGHIDLYDMGALSSTPQTVHAVVVSPMMRKDDAGARSGQPVIKSGSTQSLGTSTALSTSYTWSSAIFETNPDTSGSWSGTAVNAVQAGVKVSA